ncbi:MAG TPA: flagellar protein FlgN [Chthoniobacterales bacterium]|jgi:flagellar biosynthesis/type III secretory pathway chaperone|nr:flagellar protein FlgN [Chthoniobacterales bacterium]
MKIDWESLVQPLRDELQEHGALLNLFEEQQAAILRREPDLVLSVADAIARQADLIRECQKRRKEAVHAIAAEVGSPNEAPLSELIRHFPPAACPMLEALISEVSRLVRQTRRRAQQNQMLLARTIEVSQQILQRISPSTVTKTYSAKGQVEIGAPAAESRCVARS